MTDDIVARVERACEELGRNAHPVTFTEVPPASG
jgi:hypothetical protein